MKTKILTSLALASLMSLYFVGCSSEPKSVEELEKLSISELRKMFDDKECKYKYSVVTKRIIGEKNKDSIECENIYHAVIQKIQE